MKWRKPGIAKTFRSSVEKSLQERGSESHAILSAYGMSENISADEAFINILRFGTDMAFYTSSVAMARVWPGGAFVYHFSELNPWDRVFKGEATHVLDITLF